MARNKNTGPILISALLIGVIAVDVITNYNAMQTVNNTPNNTGGTGPTIGLIPTAGGGVNNPLDLRDFGIPWQGRIPVANSSIGQFQTMWQGYRAGIDTIKSHYNNDGQTTLNTFFAGNSNPGYAPASDGNDPVAYAKNVAAAMGIDPGDDFGPYLNAMGLTNMVTAMAKQEQGNSFVVNPVDITAALTNLGIS